jgi:hypothetical protein
MGEAHQRTRGIAPDARQAAQFVEGLRKGATRAIGDPQRGAMEPPATDLVAEWIGDGLHLGERRLRQRRNRRIAPKEPFIHGQDAGDLGLVREHLGNQDRVRISGLSPRQIAPVNGVPPQHAALEGAAAAPGNQGRHELSTGRKLERADRLYTREIPRP